MIIWIDNDNNIRLKELTLDDTGNYINTATVSVTLTTVAGSQVPGMSWPHPMSYVAGSNGTYLGVLEETLVMTKGATYIAVVDVTDGSSVGKFKKKVIAYERED
jgi:hypothetical protein